MAPRPSLASFLTKNAASAISIHLGTTIADPIKAQTYIDTLSKITVPQSGVTTAFAKCFYPAQGRSKDVLTKVLGDGATHEAVMTREISDVFPLSGQSKVVAIARQTITAVPQTADCIELVRRFTFTLLEHPDWLLCVDLVKRLDNPLAFSSKLAAAKARLVDPKLSEMDPSAYDFVATIATFQGQAPTRGDVEDVEAYCAIDESGGDEGRAYQEAIYAIAKDVFSGSMVAPFRNKSGFKRLVANTVELSRPGYFKNVFPNIETFYMTDKMDGVRAMLVIDEMYRRKGSQRIFLGANITAVSDRVYSINAFKRPGGNIEVSHTVLDTEMIVDDAGARTFYCFDVVAMESGRTAALPFHQRLEKFPRAQTLLDKYDLGAVKEFVPLTKEKYSEQIQNFYKKKRSYHIDGLIFTPQGVAYKNAAKTRKSKFDKVFNTEYYNTLSYKWKPLNQLTIDFYLMRHPTKKGAFVLCSGVDARTFKQLRMQYFDGYRAPESPNAFKYFPIQFESYDGGFDYVWSPAADDLKLCDNDPTKLDGAVGEFVFADADDKRIPPKLVRVRTDRVQDIARGEYYGNALKYAELIWHSVQYPLTIDDMCAGNGAGYFADGDNDAFRAQRGFNSFVKTHLLKKFLYPKAGPKARIMDFACGRGQDVARAIDVGYEGVVAIDQDVDALYELLERKYNLRVQRNGASATINVRRANLEESMGDVLNAIKMPPASADSAMINFALHYLCHSGTPGTPNPLVEFAKIVAHYLKPGGRIMITCFDGQSVFDALHGNPEFALSENGQIKYSIKRAFSSETLTNLDQGIDVLLPFSAGQYYREYLVNFEYLRQVFEENGFTLTNTDGFGSMMRAYGKENARGNSALSAADRAWVSLYSYAIFERA